VLGGEENNVCHLLGRGWQHDRVRHRAFDGSIALEDPKVQRVVDDVLVAHDAAELTADGW
jgi:hypothetical protein